MLTFLKLGGSLITNKAQAETPHLDRISNLAEAIKETLSETPELSLVVGHGSGSFGHVAAKHYQTHLGVKTPDDWQGFGKVSVAAARLNQIMLDKFTNADIPVFGISPSGSAISENGTITAMELRPLKAALDGGLVPLVHGDVAIDLKQGGTIVSTETVFTYLASQLKPDRILLAGDFDGVYDSNKQVIHLITSENLPALQSVLGGSAETDVTGGMVSKVNSMMDLCKTLPNLEIHLFSGLNNENIKAALRPERCSFGTYISA